MDEDDISMSQLVQQQAEPLVSDRQYNQPSISNGHAELSFSPSAGVVRPFAEPGGRRHGKWINDPIHGLIRLDPVCFDIMDTPQFQRLRDLRQLGLTYFIFPGASHNRFEHSVGVAHLAVTAAHRIWAGQGHELDMDRSDVKVVEVAGLCHDLGHGPFSHVFDREFLRRRGVPANEWSHEDMSVQIFDTILQDGYVKDNAISEDDAKRIKQLITYASEHEPGSSPAPSHKRFLFDIVANKRNSIDVDKMDYLQRDSLYCGMKIGCDFNRISIMSKVIGDEICWKGTEYNTLLKLFEARMQMHRDVYTHRKAKAVELMVVDALLAADPLLKLSERIWDPRQFVKMDDTLLRSLENWDMTHPGFGLGQDDDERPILEAQAIIKRMRRRQLYKYCSEIVVPKEAVKNGTWRCPTVMDIIGHCSGEVALREEDVILSETKIDFAMQQENPLDHVHFFDTFDDKEAYRLSKDTVSSINTDCFQEKKLRVYSRNADKAVMAALYTAFDAWCKKRFSGSVIPGTPGKGLLKRRKLNPEGACTAQRASGAKRGIEF
ncbi:hypothetical protein WJX72_003973 [[Myrmecia] bisecta]|uniref:HD domain-containing protein n=1 Tax=[Myrmecia] bisecta TaxID=41462 RepID=A0AAW1PRM7_9CHLO